ncbi:MAG: ParB/RepB/Spo0J family partition protein [Candidatus Omnitrophica bacterium]|nr:ParB/RepB/Spo0J family partition protein [Candidatus Omnitrophota bacterium]
MEKRALGRGLSALIPQREVVFVKNSAEAIVHIPLSDVKANKYQPRVEFNKEKLNDLVNSIKEKGIIQPVLVRKTIDGYELIAGERRLRAAAMLKLENVPAIIKDVGDVDMLEIALIENIQREELNPIDEARAFERLTTEFNFTQDKIAETLGKDKSTISNAIRLLGLPRKVQDHVSKGAITAGHARALLGLPTENEQYRVCNVVISKGLSVRETEKLVERRRAEAGTEKKPVKRDHGIDSIATEMQQALGTRVKIFHGKKRGTIQIEYYSVEDLNRILEIITAKKA